MKKNTLYYSILFLFALIATNTATAQVGIGTTSPKGILDVQSTTNGIVYPSVALTSTIVQAPVVNPKDGVSTLAVGTTVYNTNDTGSGVNDVEPGIYSWNGSQWVTHFYKQQSQLFEQTSVLRSASNTNYVDVPGLGIADALTFTPRYSGTFKIEVKVNYGGGEMVTTKGMHTAMAKGNYKFIFDGSTTVFETKAISTYNPDVGGGTAWDNIWKESYINQYVTLTAGVSYSFSLTFDQGNNIGFVNSGNSGLGLGYVGADIPCFIEFTYLSE